MVPVAEPIKPETTQPTMETYDTRAFGDFGWEFVNAGEKYRQLKKVSNRDALMMCGIFKQATMGDCLVEEPKRGNKEIMHREEWLKHKGMDIIDAMKLYIDKVQELCAVYGTTEKPEEEEQQQQQEERKEASEK